jgi:multisubunit Na+/H+ antiporter MnhB subunit
MSALILLKALLVTAAWSAALVIAWRSVTVLRKLHVFGSRGRAWWYLMIFGICYAVLAISALGSAVAVSQADFTLSHFGFLMGSAGLIVFDRRRRDEVNKAAP